MPPGRLEKLDPYGDIIMIDGKGISQHIGTLGSLSFEEEEDGSWSASAGVKEWSVEVDVAKAWMLRIVYIIGTRKQRKTALEKRRRNGNTDRKNIRRQGGAHDRS